MNSDNFIDELENDYKEVENSTPEGTPEETPEVGVEELILEDAPAEEVAESIAEESFSSEEIPVLETPVGEVESDEPAEEVAESIAEEPAVEPVVAVAADDVAAVEEAPAPETSASNVDVRNDEVAAPAKKEKKVKEKKEKKVKEKKPKEEKTQNEEEVEEQNQRPVAPSTLYGMNLAQGERFVRDYNLVNTGKQSIAIVTNKRFIIKGDYNIETTVDSIKGIRSCKYLQFKAVKFIFGLIFVAALVACIMLKLPQRFEGRTWLAYLILGAAGVIGLIGAIMVFTSFKKRFAINVFTRDFTEFISFHSHLGKREAQMFVQVLDGKPGRDFKRFTQEIGALLIDVQNGLYD